MKKKSFKERFESQLKKQIIEVPFTDGDGEEFTVKCRHLSEQEQCKILAIHNKTLNVKTPQEFVNLMDEIHCFLAYPKGVCLDPELTYEFWKNTGVSFESILRILTVVVKESTKMNLKLAEKYNKNAKKLKEVKEIPFYN